MKNLKNFVILLFTIQLYISEATIDNSQNPGQMESQPADDGKRELLVEAQNLLENGKKKYQTLKMQMKKDPQYLNKKSRKLFFGDINGGDLLGLLAGYGGVRMMQGGRKNYNKQLEQINDQSNFQNMHLMLKINQRAEELSTLNLNIGDLETKLDDLAQRVSAKIQSFDAAIRD